MSAITLERYRRQLLACCGPVPGRKAQPLTGIEREALEAQDEQEQASQMWTELESREI